MNLKETAQLLTFIAELDYRRFTEETVTAWHEVLGKYAYVDCREAAKIHNDTSGDFLKPGHIGAIIRTNRRRRLNSVMEISVSDVDDTRSSGGLDGFEQYRRTVREVREAIANGSLSRSDYQAYRRGRVPWDSFRRALGPREPMKAIEA
ncbi:hypothetical protein [Brevibacterium sediminis]|uniref:Uncharacterized protein n=1 Tax=Brevibacterium sediminis TaxID=1857024 RepID=A0A5C4X2Z3_9MICO|nr:hypothetical protein [Brevibacterium sediminis]TNM55901.1 hypothetical protein FHQ09_06585 [Brevibacterium sediminis]